MSKRWEYTTRHTANLACGCSGGYLTPRYLSNMGADGWEMVGFASIKEQSGYHYVFKRIAEEEK